MGSDDIISSMARDFVTILGESLELEDSPPDEFYDPITEVFGDEPTEASIIAFYRSSNGPSRLADELNDWLETDSVSRELAKDVMRSTIMNTFGPDALK